MKVKCASCGASNNYELGKAHECEFCGTPLDIPAEILQQGVQEKTHTSPQEWFQSRINSGASFQPKTKWYQKTGWIIALLILFFPVGLFLMWRHAKWNRIIKVIITAIFVIMSVRSCASGTGNDRYDDITNMVYIGSVERFETQEVAEAVLTGKGIPYTVVNAGTTSGEYLAGVNAEYMVPKNGQSGYYVNKGETVVLKVFTFEVDKQMAQDNETAPTDTLAVTMASESGETHDDSTPFEPKDVSDETIKSIKTYDDYLAMYMLIIEDYLANYEAVIKDTILYDAETFAEMRKQYDNAFEQQKGMYGAMGKQQIVGKSDLVDFLIEYRDSLKELTDNIEESLN